MTDMGHWPLVTVTTLNWNGLDDTTECLESLRRLTYPNLRVVVVDNGSADGSVPALRERFPEVLVVENGSNLGYARGFNVGLDQAFSGGGGYCLVLNNDTIVDPEAVSELVAVAEQDEKIGFVSGKVYSHEQPDVLQTTGRERDPVTLAGQHVCGGEVDRGQCETQRDYDYVDDVFLLVSRRAYEATGGYDPNFFLYYEETDWCARVRRAGFRIVYAPKAKIWHKGMVANRDLRLSPKRIYYLYRNQIVFVRRNGSDAEWSAYRRRLLSRLPRRLASFARHGAWRELVAYSRAVASGLLWASGHGRSEQSSTAGA